MFYVYALTDPRNGDQPFYIGKGVGRRAIQHFYPSVQKVKSFKNSVFKAIKADGLEPGLTYLFENLSEKEAFEKEIELIKHYGRRDIGTGILTNQTDGGDGASGSIRQPGRKHTDATKRQMSESHIGILKGRPGRKWSEEERQHLSERMKGQPGRAQGYRWTTEQKRALSAKRIGRDCPTKGRKRVYRDDGSFYFSTPESLKE